VSCDKDFKTVPGYFFHLTAMDLLKIDEESANLWHMYQAFKGDTTDGYGGVPGVGEKVGDTDLQEWLKQPTYFYQATKVMKSGPRKGEEVPYWTSMPGEEAEAHFERPLSLWDCYVSLAEKQGVDAEHLITQARVARILRASDWDFENQKPILWTPPS
jgi:5'-3' exonuclease